MTREELETLATRLVACAHFRPLPGMRDLQGRTWTPDLMWRWNRMIDRPDLEDPATVGCVLQLVRGAWDCDGMHTCRGGKCNKEWHVRYDGSRKKERPVAVAWSEAEALVAALEAAP